VLVGGRSDAALGWSPPTGCRSSASSATALRAAGGHRRRARALPRGGLPALQHRSPSVGFQPQAQRYYEEGHWRDGDLLVVCEFGFVGGLIFGYFPVLLNGATGVLINRWDPADALRLAEQHRCTYVLLMPTHAADILDAARATERQA